MVSWKPVFPVGPVALAEVTWRQTACTPLKCLAVVALALLPMWRSYTQQEGNLWCPGGRCFLSTLWPLQWHAAGYQAHDTL